MRRHADRALPLLRQRRIVDDQPGVITANHLVGLGKQDFLQRGRIPYTTCYEVMQLVVADLSVARSHGLDALAIAGANQSRHIGWAHLSPSLVTQSIQKRLQKASKLLPPIRSPASHGRPLHKPTTHESQKN